MRIEPVWSRLRPNTASVRYGGPSTRDDRMPLSRRTVVAAALASLPARAFAQVAKAYRVGLVTIGGPDTTVLGPAMAKEFAQPGIIDDLVAKHVDVIITASYPAAAAAKERAGTTPVVVTFSGDPVATGLAASLAHPGGNITGVSEIAAELSAKRLAVLKEAVPSVHAVAVLWNADDLGMTLRYQAAEVEAKRVGMLIVPLGVRAPDDFDTAFSEMTKRPPDAILMVTDVLTTLNRKRVIDFA